MAITITGLPTTLSNQTRNFILKYNIVDTNTNTSYNIVQTIDGTIVLSTTTKILKGNVAKISTTNLNEGWHTFTITASANGVSGSASIDFYVDKQSNKYLSSPIRNLRLRIDVLNFNFQKVDEISGNVLEGSITEDANSDIRRTCDITMVVSDSTFVIQPGSQIWLKF